MNMCTCRYCTFQLSLFPDRINPYTGMALGFFNLGPGTRMFGQIGVPSIFWGSQNLGDPLREKESNQLGINIDAYA